MPVQRRTFCIATVAACASLPAAAQASRPLRILVGFPPGGSVDVVARQLAEALRGGGYTVVVDNRPGAAGKLAIDALKAAAPDGETVMLMPNSIVTMESALFAKPRFDALADFAPVSATSQNAQGLAVGPATPATTLGEFLSWCQANPARANFATPGQGTPFQFLGMALSQFSGVGLTHVPYRGGAPAVTDLMGGQVSAMIGAVPVLMPQHQAGKIRLLAVSSPKRLAAAPQVPTFAESGYPGLGDVEQFGLFAPARTPPEVVTRLAQAVAAATQVGALRESFARVSLEPASSPPAAYAAQLRSEVRRWEVLLRQLGYTPQ